MKIFKMILILTFSFILILGVSVEEEPMKHISNALLALICGFFFTYQVIKMQNNRSEIAANILEGAKKRFVISNHVAVANGKVTKEYVNSSSSFSSTSHLGSSYSSR